LLYEELDNELPVRPKPPLLTLLGAPEGRETPTDLPLGAAVVVPPEDIQNQGAVEILGPYVVRFVAVAGSQNSVLGGSPGLAGPVQLAALAIGGCFFAESHPKAATAGNISVRRTWVLRFMIFLCNSAEFFGTRFFGR
jgi:hypothetical protein